MIQRIQSIFMLLAGGVLGLEFVFPFAKNSQSTDGYFSDNVFNIFDNNILLGLICTGIILSIVAIFLFNNRKLQTTINWVTMILCIVVLATCYFFLSQDQTGDLAGVNVGIGSILPILSLILLLIANRFIGKDEHLVKSMDRLR